MNSESLPANLKVTPTRGAASNPSNRFDRIQIEPDEEFDRSEERPLTTLDTELRRVLEPRTTPPAARLETIRRLSTADIAVGVLTAPVIPAINDHEIPRLLKAAAEVGAQTASFVVLRLPHAVAPLFEEWLGRHFPDRKEKVLNQIRSLREGKLNDPNFGSRMRGSGAFAERIQKLFEVAARRAGLDKSWSEMSAASFRRPAENQLVLGL